VQSAYKWWATILLVMVIVQVGFAGYGAFYTAHTIDNNTPKAITEHGFEHGFGLHAGFGYLVVLSGLILLVIGAIAGIGKWRLGRHGVLALLLILQVLLAWFGFAVPVIGFFHPVNALAIFSLTGVIVFSCWRSRPATAPEAAAT
jgi:hypothetical protein